MVQKFFRRFEIKYQISPIERDRIKMYLNGFMEMDSHVENGRDYEIRSLYFDSPTRKAYHEKLNGVSYRRKLRIRYYPNKNNPEPSLVFLEIKRKNGENVSKARLQVPFDRAFEIVYGNSSYSEIFYKELSPQDQNTLQEIWYLVRLHKLKPAIVVSYNRQALHGKNEKRFRLTFDSDIRVRKSNFDLRYGHGSKLILPRETVVMEVKFNDQIPNWAVRILQQNNCWQEKISKFASGIEQTRLPLYPQKFFKSLNYPNLYTPIQDGKISEIYNQITIKNTKKVNKYTRS